MLVVLILAVVGGIHIGISLGVSALIGTWIMFGSYELAAGQVGSTSFFALRDFVFAVIPLFVLMGEFVSRSGSAADLYRVMNFGLKRIPGRLAVATVAGNAVFAGTADGGLAPLDAALGTANAGWPWSAVPADFDLDGRVDVFCVNGFVTGDLPQDT